MHTDIDNVVYADQHNFVLCRPAQRANLIITRRLVGVNSGYMVLVSGPQNGQYNAEMLPAGKLCVMQIV